ncbi:hypothetical protein J6590_050886 [Homalodisca vitripennis]|nr:hypothetical protein J6590_050886 [Homalodisca vitripennis]
MLKRYYSSTLTRTRIGQEAGPALTLNNALDPAKLKLNSTNGPGLTVTAGLRAKFTSSCCASVGGC